MGAKRNMGSRVLRDNPQEQRFEMDASAGLVVANYRWDGDLLVTFHTEVPREPWEFRRVGSR